MADNNIIIKITSEAKLDEAQKQLESLTKQSAAYARELDDLKEKEKQDAEAIKKQGIKEEELGKALKKNKDYYRDLREQKKAEAEQTKKSIKKLNESIKAYKVLTGASGKAVQQLRAMRERLMEMEDAGEFGTEAFINLSIAASKLSDQIGDTQQRISVLASDTKYINTVMGLGDGLAGAFNIATSAAEVLGDDIEGLQKAFYKVQAAMSVVNGVQQVYNALQKDSAAMVVLNNAVHKLFNKTKKESAAATAKDAASSTADKISKNGEALATGKATAAQLALNAAFKANPIGVIIAGFIALAAAVYAAYKAFDKTERAMRAYKKAQKEYEKQQIVSSYNLNLYAHNHEVAMQKIEASENKRMVEAKKNHKTQLEISRLELQGLHERQKETTTYTDKAIKETQKELKASKDAFDKAKKARLTAKNGSKDWLKALQQENEAAMQTAELQNHILNLQRQKLDIDNEVAEKEVEISNLEKEQARARRQTLIQSQKNELELRQQSLLRTEEDYAEELAMAKKIAEDEAEAQIKALDIREMGEKAYNTEVARIRLERDKTIKNLDEQELQRQIDNAQRRTEIALAEAEAEKNALLGNESTEEQLRVLDNYYAQRRKQIEENAKFEIEAINRSTDSEEVKAEKIRLINANLQKDLTDLDKEGTEQRLNIQSQYLGDLEREVSKTEDAVSRAQMGGKLDALQANLDAQLNLYNAQQSQLEAKWKAGLISYEDYKQQEFEITKAIADAELEYQTSKMQAITDGFQYALEQIQQVSNLAFDAINQNIQAQMDALDKEYTTDWEEAQKSADKKYITEEEYQKKKAAIEMKQAKYAKAQALTDIGIQTALSVITTLAQLGATPWGIAAAAIAGAIGTAQLAVAAAKPLAQYEKGRKSGKGEYAIVGEKGAELMYIPQGASIVPHNKLTDQEAWANYGVPKLTIPELPSTTDVAQYITTTTDQRLTIDYDKLGEAVARNIPQQKAVTVNVDRAGVHVSDGLGMHTYLNRKYAGTWN